MHQQEENWFTRHKKFIFGFAVVVLLLNLLVALLAPQQTKVSWSGEATEYAVNDDDFAEVHTVALEGTLTSSVIGGTRFDGTLTISGYDELDDMTLHLERKNKRWEGYFSDSYGQAISTAVHEIYGSKEMESLMIDFWTGMEQADDDRIIASMDFQTAHFLALGGETRVVALRQYQGYMHVAQK